MCDSQNWKLWCRLCAKDDPNNNINVFFKDEHGERPGQHSLVMALHKFFGLDMDEALPKMLCSECFSFVTAMVNFSERITKVQDMYKVLVNSENINLEAIRLQYQVDLEREQDYLNHTSLLEVHYFDSKPKIDDSDEEMCEESTINPLDSQIDLKFTKSVSESIKLTQKMPQKESDSSRDTNNDDDLFTAPISRDSSSEDELSDEPLSTLRAELKVKKEEKTIIRRKGRSFDRKSKARVDILPKEELESVNDEEEEEGENNGKHIKNEKETKFEKIEKRKKGTKKGDSSQSSRAYTCAECSQVFKRSQNYNHHLKTSHGKSPPPISKCMHCPERTFATQRKLENHLQTHLPPELKKITPCPHCDKKFASKNTLQSHIKYIHTDDRSFICEECGITMRTKAALKDHMLTHTDYAPFECEVCKKGFKNQVRLKNHMEIHSPLKHVCPKCGLQLNSRATLNRHLLVHSDNMQHKCDYCGRAFKRAKALKNHLILHTGLKPYSCDFCDRTFANGSNCRTHKKKAHPEELAALEAAGGGKVYTKNIPKLEALKAVTKAADNLAPVVSKQSGCFAFGKKPKPETTTTENDTSSLAKPTPPTQSRSPIRGSTETLQSNFIHHSPQSSLAKVSVPPIETIYSLKQEHMPEKDSPGNQSAEALEADMHSIPMPDVALQLHRQQLLLQGNSISQPPGRGYFQFATE